MELKENFVCPLCLELAKEAVESSCCSKIYCQQCLDKAIKKFSQCPLCRSKSVSWHTSKISRKVISEIKIPCEHCSGQIQNGAKESHLEKCPKMKVACKLCKIIFLQEEIPKHTAIEHGEDARAYLIKYLLDQRKQKTGKIQPVKENNEGHNYFKPVINKFQRKAALGTTAKYYCGGKLVGLCSCCNGFCGPENGENCDACMELDVKRWKLQRTYLVNSSGYVCQVLRVQGIPKVACFRIIGHQSKTLFSRPEQVTCKPGNPCGPCQQMEHSFSIGRYTGLY